MSTLAFRERIQDVLNNALNPGQSLEGLDLIDSGVMDSLALVSVIMELETAFNLSIPFEKLEIDNFRTLDSITTFIASESSVLA